MKSMKSNRIVAILATISLLVGSLAVGGVLTASAVSEGWYGSTTVSTVTKGQFKHFARYTASTADVVEGTSLILGMVPTGSPYNSSPIWQHYNDTTGNISNLTDGVIGTSSDTAEYTILRDGNTSTKRYLYFNLGGKYEISDFIVASSQYHGGPYGAKNVNIYVANTDTLHASRTGAFTVGAEDNDYSLVYSNWGFNVSSGGPTVGNTSQNNSTWTNALNFHIQPEDGATVTGQYVCFEISCSIANYGNYFSELAVYGTKVVEEEEPVLATYTHFARYTDDLTTVVAGDSLIKGMIPYGNPYSNKDLWESTNETGCPIAKLTDGKAGTNTSNDWTQIAGDVTGTNSRFLYFDLGATYNISDFIVASAQHIGGHALLRNVRIYVAETDNDMVTSVTEGVADGYTMVYENWGYAAEPTVNASWASSIGNAGIGNYHIVPGEGQTIVGRYVCFELDYSTYQTAVSASDTAIRIGELAVYGEKVDAVKSLGGQVSSYVNNNTVAKLRLGFNVAVTGVTRNESYEGDYTAAKVTVNGTAYDIAIDEETGLPIIGALVARGGDGQQVSEDLVVGIENDQVQDVHAKKIYDVYDDSITFTALITNVPSDYFDEQIIGRAYVGYMDGDTIHYVYSNLLSRSVSDVKDNTDMQ